MAERKYRLAYYPGSVRTNSPGNARVAGMYGSTNNKSGGSKSGSFLTRLTQPGYDSNQRPATTWGNFMERAQNREGTRVPATRNDNTFSNNRNDYGASTKSPTVYKG